MRFHWIFIAALTLPIAALPAPALAKEPSIFSTVVKKDRPLVPKYLFHWTSQEGITKLAETNKGSDKAPVGKIAADHFLAQCFPALNEQRGIYSWSHPTNAVAAHTDEVYAKTGAKGEPPRLIIMKPKKSARVLGLKAHRDKNCGKKENNPKDLHRYDLIYHEYTSEGGKYTFREWVVLNPDAIEAFSASPSALPREVREEMLRSTKPEFKFKPDEVFFENTDVDWKFRKKIVDAYLKSGNRDIPKTFIRKLEKSPALDADTENTEETKSREAVAPAY